MTYENTVKWFTLHNNLFTDWEDVELFYKNGISDAQLKKLVNDGILERRDGKRGWTILYSITQYRIKGA